MSGVPLFAPGATRCSGLFVTYNRLCTCPGLSFAIESASLWGHLSERDDLLRMVDLLDLPCGHHTPEGNQLDLALLMLNAPGTTGLCAGWVSGRLSEQPQSPSVLT